MSNTTARVQYIPITNIKANPHNPRRLFDEEPMKILEESIKLLGILVPLDVYPEDNSKFNTHDDYFILLDGERRWRCAKELNLRKVPCIIVDSPSEERNILTMFHIHNVREGWQLMPTALKLKELMKMLKTDSERSLSELTKLSLSQVRRCKILLTYPVKFQELMLAPPTERFKADFFIDLNRFRGPAIDNKFKPWVENGDAYCIEKMIAKYESGTIKAVTEFRQLSTVYKASIEKNKLSIFEKFFNRFLAKEDMQISDIEIPGISFAHEIKEVSRSAKRLLTQLENIDFENIYIEEELIKDLKKISKLINVRIQNALLDNPSKENN